MFKHIPIDLDHEFFNYVPEKHRDYILKNKHRFNSFTYCYNNTSIFTLIIENLGDRLHVYELGGSFQFHCDKIVTFMDVLTEKMGYTYYTAVYKDDRLAKIFKSKYGIEAVIGNEYKRVI